MLNPEIHLESECLYQIKIIIPLKIIKSFQILQEGKLNKKIIKRQTQPNSSFNINELTSNPLAKMGYEYTEQKMKKFFSENNGYFGSYVFSQKLRSYFDVDNSYLISKIQSMFFPFKSRKLQFSGSSGVVSSLEEIEGVKQQKTKWWTLSPSIKDTEELDLYIPLMCLLCFVLLSCFSSIMHNQGSFSPANITTDIANCLMLSLIEVLLTKCGFMIGMNLSIDFLDCLALCTYKYAG